MSIQHVIPTAPTIGIAGDALTPHQIFPVYTTLTQVGGPAIEVITVVPLYSGIIQTHPQDTPPLPGTVVTEFKFTNPAIGPSSIILVTMQGIGSAVGSLYHVAVRSTAAGSCQIQWSNLGTVATGNVPAKIMFIVQ